MSEGYDTVDVSLLMNCIYVVRLCDHMNFGTVWGMRGTDALNRPLLL